MLALLAQKSVKQRFHPNERLLQIMETFRQMTNDYIQTGLAERRTPLRQLSLVLPQRRVILAGDADKLTPKLNNEPTS